MYEFLTLLNINRVTPKKESFSCVPPPLLNREVVSFSRYEEGRACPVSGSISVVNDFTRTYPIETVIPTSFEGGQKFTSERLPTSEHQLKCGYTSA